MKNILDIKRSPTHPGAILREDVLPALGLSKTEIAKRLRISRPVLYDILDEKAAVTPQMALRLGKFCGNDPMTWLRMQTAHDLWHASRRDARKLATIEPVNFQAHA